ncbi:hypothetical protein MMC12_007741 [Toensbergia leucococca]|nr:hypothetical protein [Toensbergia leucococca]
MVQSPTTPDKHKRMSISPTPSRSPRITYPPSSPARSITTEIGSLSRNASLRSPRLVNRTIDLFDASDAEDEEGAEGSTVGIKSPRQPPDNPSLQSLRTALGSVPVTPTANSEFADPQGSMRAVISPRNVSVAIADSVAESYSSPRTASLSRHGSSASTRGMKSPNPTIDTTATGTDSTGTRAGNRLSVNFLPKFLRLANGGDVSPEGSEGRDQGIGSCFEEVSSEEEGVVNAARRARVERPILVEQRSIGPSRGKASQVLGENVKGLDAWNAAPTAAKAASEGKKTTDDGEKELGSPKVYGLGIDMNPKSIIVDGLRSHPLYRTSSLPVRPRRKVAFPLPTLDEIRPEHRFLRQEIVSTPYPEDEKGASKNMSAPASRLIEGEGPRKRRRGLGFAVAAVVVFIASLTAVLLWIFLGVGGGREKFRGAAGRVETGAVLGVLVLMLGWTGIGAWGLSCAKVAEDIRIGSV